MYATPPTLDAIHAWAMRGGLAKFNISRDAILAAGQGREAPTPVSSLPLPGANNGFAGGAAMMNSGMGGGDGNAGLAPGMKSRGRMVQGADGRWTFKRE